MKQINERSNKIIKDYPVSILFSLFFIALGFLFLKISQTISDESCIVIVIAGFFLGIISFIINTRIFLQNCKKSKQIQRTLEVGSPLKATIEGERNIGILKGNGLVCSAEINGIRHEFISEQISYFATYACQELGIKTITVYVNMQNPEEYVVDLREIEDRIVDLT